MSERIAIYTAVFGKRDWVPSITADALAAIQKAKVDLICFTPEQDIIDYARRKKWPWDFVKVKQAIKDCSKAAKEYKIRPHMFLQAYTMSLWIDANVGILSDPVRVITASLAEADFAVYKHPVAVRNAYEEADRCVSLGKASRSIVSAQVDAYREAGYPTEQSRIPMCRIIARRHMSPENIAFGEAWFEELTKHSNRDQISMPFVKWQTGFEHGWIPIPGKTWFSVGPHKVRKP